MACSYAHVAGSILNGRLCLQAQIVTIHENADNLSTQHEKYVLELQQQLTKVSGEYNGQVKLVLELRIQLERQTSKEEQAKASLAKYQGSIDCLNQQLQLAEQERKRLMQALAELMRRRCCTFSSKTSEQVLEPAS